MTISCAEGDEGFVYEDIADYSVEELDVTDLPETKTKVMLNLANPGSAFRWWRMPADGIGLARMEFVVSNAIRVHPMALVHFDTLKDEEAKGRDRRADRRLRQQAGLLRRQAGARIWRALPRPSIRSRSSFA